MKITTDDAIQPIRGRTIIDVFYQLFSFLFTLLIIPFRWGKRGIQIIREDNEKIASFQRWHKKQRIASRRQRKFNDEI